MCAHHICPCAFEIKICLKTLLRALIAITWRDEVIAMVTGLSHAKNRYFFPFKSFSIYSLFSKLYAIFCHSESLRILNTTTTTKTSQRFVWFLWPYWQLDRLHINKNGFACETNAISVKCVNEYLWTFMRYIVVKAANTKDPTTNHLNCLLPIGISIAAIL